MTEKEDLTARRAAYQRSLFPPKLDEFIAEMLVSADEMKSWHVKSWLSFDPAAQCQFGSVSRFSSLKDSHTLA